MTSIAGLSRNNAESRDGKFGIMDTGRPETEFKEFHGHMLDYKLLELLKSKMMSA